MLGAGSPATSHTLCPASFPLCSSIMKEEIFSPSLFSSSLVVGGKVVLHRVIREGYLSLPLTCYSTRESQPCISPGQHKRALPDGGGMGELAPKVCAWESWPCNVSAMPQHGLQRFPHQPLSFVIYGWKAGVRANLGVIRAREMSLPLTCCSTEKSRPYTSPGQHSKTGPGYGGYRS